MAQLLREVGESPSLEVFMSHGDVALRAAVSGHRGWAGVGLDDLTVFSSLSDDSHIPIFCL